MELLKDYRATQYRIEIGEETLSLADYNAERELRIEYLTSVGQFLSQAGKILEAQPQAAPMLLKMIAWTTASFRGAADIETMLDEAIKASTQPKEPGPPAPPPPEVQGAQAKQQLEQTKAQAKMQVADNDTRNATMQAIVKVVEGQASTENAIAVQAAKPTETGNGQ